MSEEDTLGVGNAFGIGRSDNRQHRAPSTLRQDGLCCIAPLNMDAQRFDFRTCSSEETLPLRRRPYEVRVM
jgi:hypothetical protein